MTALEKKEYWNKLGKILNYQECFTYLHLQPDQETLETAMDAFPDPRDLWNAVHSKLQEKAPSIIEEVLEEAI